MLLDPLLMGWINQDLQLLSLVNDLHQIVNERHDTILAPVGAERPSVVQAVVRQERKPRRIRVSVLILAGITDLFPLCFQVSLRHFSVPSVLAASASLPVRGLRHDAAW